MRKIFLISCVFFLTSCYNQETIVDKSKLFGNDYRLYQNTPAWTLAKALKNEDVKKIKNEILNNKVSIDYKEPIFGSSLLTLAVWNSKYESVKALLELGANPNFADNYRGTTPLIRAAKNDDPKYLELLLRYKGNPNAIESVSMGEKDDGLNTALTSAIALSNVNSLEKVKLLIESGADINYYKEGQIDLPISVALIMDKMDVALYLLEHGADYNLLMNTTSGGHKVYILEALRKSLLGLDTKEYEQKLIIINFLKNQGLDYNKEPIPQRTLDEIKNKYGIDWENYVKKY